MGKGKANQIPKVLAGNMSTDELLERFCSAIYRGMKRFEAADGNYESLIRRNKDVVVVGERRTYDHKLIEATILADPDAPVPVLADRAKCNNAAISRIRARLRQELKHRDSKK